MYEEEVHNALTQRDLQTVWQLMMKRSTWLQTAELSNDEAQQALQATGEIQERIRTEMAAIEKELRETRQGFRVAEAYERGRQV